MNTSLFYIPSTTIFTNVIDYYFHEPHSSLLNGILFGIPLHISTDFTEQFKRVGLLHIVVLSGMNITFLAAIVRNLTMAFSQKTSALVSIVVIIAFILFAGGEPPIVRAGITGVIGLLAIIYERRKLAFYTLCTSAVLIALFKFEWITTVSFQLSFGATLGILLFGPRAHGSTSGNKLLNYIKQDLHTSCAAQVFTVPIICIYFRQISLVAPVANVLISFTIAPLMILGFLTALLGKLHIGLGMVPAYISYGILVYIINVVSFLDSLPGIFIQY